MGRWTVRRLVVYISSGLSILGIWWCAPAVYADAASYPYPDVPCIWAPYDSAGTAANWCPDYDWGYTPDDESAANVISPYGYYYRNCTDYTAWKVSLSGVAPTLYKGLGNAKDWAARAAQKGLRVDNTPAVGAVAVRTSGFYGHTAYVEAVDAAGTITVSQYNYRADGNYSEQSGVAADFGFSVFIHFEDLAAPPPLEPAVGAEPVVPEATPVPLPQTATPIAAPLQPAIDEEPAEPLVASEVTTAAAEETPRLPLVAAATQIPADPPPVTTVAALATPEPPPRSVWRTASESPPVVDRPKMTPVAAQSAAPPVLAFDPWPLIGLLGVVLIREATLRRAYEVLKLP